MRIFKIEKKIKKHKQDEVQLTVRYPVRMCWARKWRKQKEE